MTRFMILGAGGLGKAIAQYSAGIGHDIFLLGRHIRSESIPDTLIWDIDNSKCFTNLAQFIFNKQVDVLVNTLGILHDNDFYPEKSISQLDENWFMHSMQVNCLSTLLLLKQLNRILPPDSPLKFIALSARVGSISDNHLGGWLSYRVSKAALNMGVKTAALEWKYKHKNAVIVTYHPGTVDTNLSKPFQRNVKNLFTPTKAAKYLYDFIKILTPNMSGGFYSWEKQKIEF